MRPLALATPLAALLALHGGGVASQESIPGVRAELVQLDVVVTDGRGAAVPDLRREDFEVLEDGRPQNVTQFFSVASARAGGRPASPAAPVDTATAAPSAPELPAPGRQVVVVVDDLHIGLRNLAETKKALHRLMDEVLAPDDNVGLVTTSGASASQNFTRDRGAVKQAIDRLTVQERTVGRARNTQMTAEQAALILRGDWAALQLAANAMVHEPGSVLSPNSPQVALDAPPGAASALGAGVGADAVEKAAQRQAMQQAAAVLNESLRFSLATLNVVEDVVRGLSRLPGRKLCLLVSDGFLDGAGTRESRSVDLRRVLDAATRSGTVVYSLDSRGLVTGSADAGTAASSSVMPGLQFRVDRQVEELLRDTLTTLADGTGGFLVRGTDLAGGLRRMLEDNATYYLLAYEPANKQRDGRFRKIEVRLRGRPELSVRTRKGYFAPDAKAEAARSRRAAAATTAAPGAASSPAEALAALAAPIGAGGIPVVLSAGFASLPPAGSQVLVRAHVDLTGLRWREAEGRHRADLELVGGVFDAGGQPVGAPFGRRAELDVAAAELERAKAAGLSYQEWIPLGPGRYDVRMLARERSLAQQGGATERVDVPDLGDKKLAISAVFLSTSAPAAAGGLDAAAGRFKPGDNVSFQFYVYNAARDAGGATDLVFQAQVWSQGKAIAASRPQPARLEEKDGMPVPETNSLSLEGLAAGAYELRVVVEDRKARATTLRRVPFTIH